MPLSEFERRALLLRFRLERNVRWLKGIEGAFSSHRIATHRR